MHSGFQLQISSNVSCQQKDNEAKALIKSVCSIAAALILLLSSHFYALERIQVKDYKYPFMNLIYKPHLAERPL